MKISVVIPVFNERENIPLLSEKLEKILTCLSEDYELIFVNDGSWDGSAEELERLHRKNPRIKLITLSRNFGHQVALSAGMELTSGDVVIMMDGDLQHPPELIPDLFKKWQEGYQVVYTIRQETADAGHFKIWSASLFYWLINLMARTPIPAGASDFRLVDRVVVNELRKFKENSRFFRGLLAWLGFRQIGVPYLAPSRLYGASRYALGEMMRLALDGVTSFSSFPLRISTYVGLLVSGISFIYGMYTLYMGIFSDKVVPGWASLMIVVLFLGGVQMITLGIMGEYLGRIYDQVKGRPLYVVQKKLGDFTGSE